MKTMASVTSAITEYVKDRTKELKRLNDNKSIEIKELKKQIRRRGRGLNDHIPEIKEVYERQISWYDFKIHIGKKCPFDIVDEKTDLIIKSKGKIISESFVQKRIDEVSQ